MCEKKKMLKNAKYAAFFMCLWAFGDGFVEGV